MSQSSESSRSASAASSLSPETLAARQALRELTIGQRQVIVAFVELGDSAAVAHALALSIDTVYHHFSDSYARVSRRAGQTVRSRAQLLALVRQAELGWLKRITPKVTPPPATQVSYEAA